MKSSFYGMICFLSKNLNLPYKDYERFFFFFDDMDPEECQAMFRFCKNDIPLLADIYSANCNIFSLFSRNYLRWSRRPLYFT